MTLPLLLDEGNAPFRSCKSTCGRRGVILYNGVMVIILFKSVLLSLLLSVGLSLLIGKFDSIVKWWRKQSED